jgi:hypothetical protein
MTDKFKEHMKGKYPDLDTDRILSLIDQNVAEIQPNPANPTKECVVPIGCDLNKNLIIKIISDYLNPKPI